jgi:hypothetical protein
MLFTLINIQTSLYKIQSYYLLSQVVFKRLDSIIQLIFVMQVCCALFEVRTGFQILFRRASDSNV